MAGAAPSPEWCGMDVTFSMKAGGGDSIRGEVYAYDQQTDTLVLKENAVGQHLATYRVVKGVHIDLASVKLSGAAVPPEPVPPIAQQTLDRYVLCWLFEGEGHRTEGGGAAGFAKRRSRLCTRSWPRGK
eukprot:1665682-Rhodomonas_salina.2